MQLRLYPDVERMLKEATKDLPYKLCEHSQFDSTPPSITMNANHILRTELEKYLAFKVRKNTKPYGT